MSLIEECVFPLSSNLIGWILFNLHGQYCHKLIVPHAAQTNALVNVNPSWINDLPCFLCCNLYCECFIIQSINIMWFLIKRWSKTSKTVHTQNKKGNRGGVFGTHMYSEGQYTLHRFHFTKISQKCTVMLCNNIDHMSRHHHANHCHVNSLVPPPATTINLRYLTQQKDCSGRTPGGSTKIRAKKQ